MKRTRSMLTLALALTAGCYTWHPGGPDAIRPEADIRARLDADEARRLPAYVKGDDRRTIEGKVVAEEGDSLVLFVTNGATRRGEIPGRVKVARGSVDRLEIKKIDGMRTSIFSAGGAGLAGFLLAKAIKSEDPNQQIPTPGDIDEARIPLLRIPFSLPFLGGR